MIESPTDSLAGVKLDLTEKTIYILPQCSMTAARVLNPAGMDAQFERLRCAISHGILNHFLYSHALLYAGTQGYQVAVDTVGEDFKLTLTK